MDSCLHNYVRTNELIQISTILLLIICLLYTSHSFHLCSSLFNVPVPDNESMHSFLVGARYNRCVIRHNSVLYSFNSIKKKS